MSHSVSELQIVFVGTKHMINEPVGKSWQNDILDKWETDTTEYINPTL